VSAPARPMFADAFFAPNDRPIALRRADPFDGFAYPVDDAGVFDFGDRSRFSNDADGIVVVRYGAEGPARHNPAYVAWQALALHNRSLDAAGGGHAERFARCVAWLRAHAIPTPAGPPNWPYDFDYREGTHLCRAPWFSCLASGLAVSALVRHHARTGEAASGALADAASELFHVPLERGGFLHRGADGLVFLEEYPHPVHILDGHLFALIALHDLSLYRGNKRAATLRDECAASLERHARRLFDRGGWSAYGTHGILSTPAYHRLNRHLLRWAGETLDRPALVALADRWDRAGRRDADRRAVRFAYRLRYGGLLIRKAFARLAELAQG